MPIYQKTQLFDNDIFNAQYLEKDINSFDSKESAIEYYFKYYKENGYPNYDISNYDATREMQNLVDFDTSTIFSNDVIGQTMHSCGFLWCFFPDWINTSTEGGASLADNWNNDEKLKTLIRKTIDFNLKHSDGKWSTNRIRQNAKVYCATQTVSNFRPTASKCLYDMFGEKGAIFDPCAGWGGRLLGALASDCQEYVCCDPSTSTAEGLAKLAKMFSYRNKKVVINNCCAEDYTPEANYFDFAFTSPPYFNTEHYSTEETQSYVKYLTYDKWREEFLRPMIANCYTALKADKYFALNIANVKTAPTLEEDSVRIALECGFNHTDTLKLALSSIAGKGVKYEPIFIFKK